MSEQVISVPAATDMQLNEKVREPATIDLPLALEPGTNKPDENIQSEHPADRQIATDSAVPKLVEPTDESPEPTSGAASTSAPEPEMAAEAQQAAPASSDVQEKSANAEQNVAESEPAEPTAQLPAYLENDSALVQFFERLPAILSSTGYHEMWGVELKDSEHVPTVNVLIKFLRANEGNVKLAEDQLTKALEWRKSMQPTSLIEGTYSARKFGGLGYVTTYPESNTVVTWNIYGAVKNIDDTFADLDEFIKWRVALMEMAIKDMKLAEADSVIDYSGEDRYQMIQVHDYKNVSFLRLNPTLRAATKKTIEVFAMAYPELLREKFFVNVPAIMGWMFAAMKLFLSKNTTRKFHPISNGVNLAQEFPALTSVFPRTYGGEGPELHENAQTVQLVEEAVSAPDSPTAEAAAAEQPDAAKETEPSESANETKDENSKANGEQKTVPVVSATAVAPAVAEAN